MQTLWSASVSERLKRLNLVIPTSEYRALHLAAQKRQCTITTLIRALNRVGLEALKPNVTLVMREDGKEDKVVYIA